MCPVNAELKVIDFKDYKQLGQEQGDSKGAPDSSEILFLPEMGLFGQFFVLQFSHQISH